MNHYYSPSGPKIAIYGLVILAAFLIMAYFVRNMSRLHDPGPINQARVEERIKARKDLEAASRTALSSTGDVDKARGIVRLPITTAMQLVVQQYQDPQAAREGLLQRVQNATAPVPEQPSEFE